MASRWVEETFNSINLEGIKRSLVELLGTVVRDVEIEIHGCRNKNAKQRKVEEAEQIGAFLEEELIFSMLHSGWDASSSPIGEFESPYLVSQLFPELGSSMKSMMEAKLPLTTGPKDNHPAEVLMSPNELGHAIPIPLGSERGCTLGSDKSWCGWASL